mgnify:CR=1 FL=1
MDKKDYSVIENYMHACMKDSAHDVEHVYRVLNNALVIARSTQNVDYDILIAACLLHDIARPEQIADPKLCHATVGSEKARMFLVNNGFSTEFAERVKDCIRTHRFRKNDQPETLEAKILFDADKLDVAGAIGIARTLVYKGTVSDPLYTRKQDGSISDGAEDETSSFFREYKFKLENLYDRFYTETGKQLALNRRKAAEQFYENLYQEVSALDEEGKKLLSLQIN